MAKTKAADKNDSKDKKSKKTPAEEVRDLVVCLGIAVLLALMIKAFLIEIFVIPSGSMEPTLHGRPDGGDRVLCTKVNYLWREPKRWEIFVFLFPYEQALERYLASAEDLKDYKGQNFIKRCVGLPGEELAIVRGDIYVQSAQHPSWTRQVKTDRVQRALWIPVYEEDFSELVYQGKGRKEDFKNFWRESGELQWEITPAKTLRMTSETAGHLRYRCQIRRHADQPTVEEFPGVADRYVVRQPVTFRSPNGVNTFRKTVTNQKIAARCPWTGEYVLEDQVEHYARRSDVPFTRLYYEGNPGYVQGESSRRTIDYFKVVDLRLRCRVRLSPGAQFGIELQDDAEQREAVLTCAKDGKSHAYIRGNGQPPPDERIAPVALAAGVWHDLEFYNVDGEVRLYVNSEDEPLLTWAHTPTTQVPGTLGSPSASCEVVPRKSGVMLSVREGTAEIEKIALDRDIHYYSGVEGIATHPGVGRHRAMSGKGRFVVQDEEYMAMGDNCPSSNDSRTWGAVPKANRRGPAILVWWPLHRLHPIVMP